MNKIFIVGIIAVLLLSFTLALGFDLNKDNKFNVKDLKLLMLACEKGIYKDKYDLNKDMKVNWDDFDIAWHKFYDKEPINNSGRRYVSP